MARAVANPYYREYRKFLDDKETDKSALGWLASVLGVWLVPGAETRSDLTRKYGFAIPNPPALNFIANWGPVVEMGAGTGYWASLLRKMKVDIRAFDNFSGYGKNGYGFGTPWVAILKGTPVTLEGHGDRTLFLCWPDYNSPFASNCLRHYPGDRLIYVGEGYGGCTGNDRFHARLKKEWTLVKTISLPTWPGIHDNLYAYERKEKLRDSKTQQAPLRKLRAPRVAPPVRRKRSTGARRTRQVPR